MFKCVIIYNNYCKFMAISFDNIKRFASDVNDRLLGRGRQVDFRQEVRRLESTGQSHEEAQKQVFLDRFSSARAEAASGVIDFSSGEFKDLLATLPEIFSETEIKSFETLASGTHYRSLPVMPVTPGQISKMKAYLDRRFGAVNAKRVSLGPYITDGARTTFLLNSLMRRFEGEAYANPHDLNVIIAAHPEMAADLGKIIQAKKLLETHEKGAKRQVDAAEARYRLGENAKQAFDDIAWHGLGSMIKTVFNFTRGKQKLWPAFKETATYLKNTLVGVTRVSFGTLETLIKSLDALRK
jgi:hypothetical protein